MADGYGQQQQPGSPDSSPHSDNESGGGHYQDASVREQDRFLPIANVSRIMKKALPSNAKISKDAKETVQECVSEFISFITGEASDKCQREKRKTINGDDLLWAMSTLGFEDYVEPLKVYLHKYRELEGEKASTAKQGDQSGGKEVNQGGMPSMNVGMQSAMNGGMNNMSGGPINGGMHPAAMPMMQQQYGQQQQPPPGMMYAPTHQMMSQYQQMPMQNGPGQPRGI